MNLGAIFIAAFLVLFVASIAVPVVVALFVGRLIGRRDVAVAFLLVMLPLSIAATNGLFHARLFAW